MLEKEKIQINKPTDFKEQFLTKIKKVESTKVITIPCVMKNNQCEQCKGRGYQLFVEGPTLEARLCSCIKNCQACYGKMLKVENDLARPCFEPSPERIANLLTEAMIPARYAEASIDQFGNFTGNGKQIVERLKNWLKSFRPHGKGIMLTGGVGAGKTYLMCALTKVLVAKGFRVKFVDFFQLLNALKAAYAADKTDDSILGPLLRCDVLVIDELGKGRNTDWELTIIDHLVMGRYNQKKTIVTSTNYGLKSLPPSEQSFDFEQSYASRSTSFSADRSESLEQRVGKRIYSRLYEMSEILEMSGEDFRRRAEK